jgi:hypothetical protein
MVKWLNNLINRKLAQHRMKHNHSGVPQRQFWYEKLMDQVNHSRTIGVLMMIVLWCFSSFILILPQLTPREYKLMVNRKAPETIIAEIDFTYEDSAKTESLRHSAEAAVQKYYRFSSEEKRRAAQNFRKFADALDARIGLERQNRKYTPADNDEYGMAVASLPPEIVNDLASLYDDELTGASMARDFEKIIQRGVLSERDKQSLPPEEKIRLVDEFGREQERLVSELPDAHEAVVYFVMELARQNPQVSVGRLTEAGRPLGAMLEGILGGEGNLERMDERRRHLQLQARKQVQPVMEQVVKHQVIVHRGEIITPKIMETIDAYNKDYSKQFKVGSYIHMVYVIYWCLLLVVFVMIYLYHIHPKVVKDNGSMMLCIWVIIAGIALNYLTARGFYVICRAWDISPELIGMALPVGFCAALLAVTVGFRVSLYMGFFVATITAMMIGDEFNNAIGGMLLCGVTALAVRNADNYRSFFVRTMLAVVVSFIVMGAAIILLLADSISWREVLWGLGVAAANGFLTATLALLALFVLEVFFRVSTNMSLLMFDYNHPLLVELRRKAPGTFHHSLTVSTLAEAAAKEIHSNPIPARVAALFHDIGKINKPGYFAENIPGENKHDELRPRMSSMVIMNHVKAGLTLASKYRLPRIIRKTIEQHHGTDMVYYFYRKAQDAQAKGDAVEELEFRYPGPLPSSKTVVLVSLADACEAACRSIKKPTPAKIEQMVCDIFERRIRDGQLDHADITMGELSAVRDCFIRELTSIHHARMAYPKEHDEDEDRPFMAAEKPKDSAESKTSVPDA